GNKNQILTHICSYKLKRTIFMNLIKNSLVVILLTLFFTSCNKDDEQILSQSQSDSETFAKQGKIISKRNYSSNSLVVKYNSWVTNADKNFIRNFFGVMTYKLCSHCANESIELWMFDRGIEIEPKKETINNHTGGMGFPTNPAGRAIQYVEYNYDLQIASTEQKSENKNVGTPTIEPSYSSYIKNSNSGVTIAVFDTGINPSLGSSAHFPSKFLYNAAGEGIAGVYSGWDFVNNDHNAYDDEVSMHGSAVTSVITRALNYSNIDYQILPLKIADSSGKASYFNLLCSLNFAIERKVTIMQMSLGWYGTLDDPNNNIFVNLASQVPNTTIICSAGNYSNYNDGSLGINSFGPHYPSGYPSFNIISVTSCNDNYSNISDFSNYGAISVDYFAKGENISFSGNLLRGTSFAAPQVTAKVAIKKAVFPAISTPALIDFLTGTGISLPPTFDTSRPTKYNKIIIP
ncbi:MAG: S8 family serine peptidase, partial [Limnohabitans sp.]|nr:S8 family serine peptidase [Limnohabitans sp.]